ncbi:hypothetical protein K443DRAFT_676777 [Laccaria amethystina LaAM-08-1]|uniref:Uncharacterized protein n=1 Tax=Laccaria amethystina LaAM-08-1 TaxID=1095629 RepID=A0A0C9Y618_9AGAR|nr:hypothetical protein K443DRAFT_676777 [Laccaria amethystina LaAM-08-1]
MNVEIATFTGSLHCKQACKQSLISLNLFALWPSANPDSYPPETTLHTDRGDSVISS